jgi:hypothetical protein
MGVPALGPTAVRTTWPCTNPGPLTGKSLTPARQAAATPAGDRGGAFRGVGGLGEGDGEAECLELADVAAATQTAH